MNILMNSMAITVAVIALCGGAENPVIDEQLEKIRPNLEKIRADYAKKVQAENDKLVKAIQAALDKETRAGRLESALALKEALEKARKGDYIADFVSPQVDDLLSENEALPAVQPLCAALPAASYSASSSWGAGYLPDNAKYSSATAWVARPADASQWLQVDLGRTCRIHKIGIKGRGGVAQWVTAFRVQYGTDPTKLSYVCTADGKPIQFPGNADFETEVVNAFPQPVRARFVRLVPVTWNAHISLRFELYGR